MIKNLVKTDGLFSIDCNRKTPKYQQIVHCITKSIKSGKLQKGDRLLSVNEFSNEFLVSRDTVQKAYEILERDGVVIPVRGKGFYVKTHDVTLQLKILLVFNKMSNYKKLVYDSFISTIGSKATVDLKIYHCNTVLFSNYILSTVGEYDYYVVMPHFYENLSEAYDMLKIIPADKLILLDKYLQNIPGDYSAVYQDFVQDIKQSLETGLHLIKKYQRLVLVFPENPKYPIEIVWGFKTFCLQNNINCTIIPEIDSKTVIMPKDAFIVIEETDLVNLIKHCKQKKYPVGKQIGIVSYNDTALKEILLEGITVISTDHTKMGESAARLILENKREKIKNPFALIIRNSL